MGGWAVLHEIRSEYAQIMTSIYLLAAGPGPWSLDALLLRRRRASAGGLERRLPQLGPQAAKPEAGTLELKENQGHKAHGVGRV